MNEKNTKQFILTADSVSDENVNAGYELYRSLLQLFVDERGKLDEIQPTCSARKVASVFPYGLSLANFAFASAIGKTIFVNYKGQNKAFAIDNVTFDGKEFRLFLCNNVTGHEECIYLLP